MRKLLTCCLVGGVALGGALAVQASDEAMTADLKEKDLKVLDQAPEILRSLTDAPDNAIPQNLLEKAECVLVFPNVAKGAFIIGGEGGRGVATCRKEAHGSMGSPVLFTIGGASVGWQIGGQSTDLVLLVMDRNGMQNLLRDEFKIGGEASVAAGPVGRTAEASTDILLGAQMLSWSRTEGLFAGASLEGSVIKPNADANERLYGRAITASEIFEQNPNVPQAAAEFVNLASRVTGGDEYVGQAGVNRDAAQPSDTYARTNLTDTGMKQDQDQRADSANQRDTYAASGTDAQGGRLPSTASPLPLIALGGFVSLLAAGCLRAWRAR